MDWLLKFGVVWLSIDIVTIATAWYVVTTIKPRWPDWWKREVADFEPNFLVLIFSVVALVITEIIARIAGMNG